MVCLIYQKIRLTTYRCEVQELCKIGIIGNNKVNVWSGECELLKTTYHISIFGEIRE